jgi:DNA repair exonuclease SbcCD ATPase subunit
VAIERDSFREAMKDMLVGMGADKEVPNDPPRPATDLHASSTAHTTAEGTTLQNLKGVMGSFLTTASPPTGTGIGSVANTPSSPSAIANLDGEIKRLRKEVKATEELKKRLEEVERQLEQAESAAKDAENWADEEFETLTSQVESANKDRDDVYEKLEAAKVEMDRLQKQISRGAAKVSQSEEKTHALQSRIDTLEREIRETQLSAINPEDFKAAQDKVQELLG